MDSNYKTIVLHARSATKHLKVIYSENPVSETYMSLDKFLDQAEFKQSDLTLRVDSPIDVVDVRPLIHFFGENVDVKLKLERLADVKAPVLPKTPEKEKSAKEQPLDEKELKQVQDDLLLTSSLATVAVAGTTASTEVAKQLEQAKSIAQDVELQQLPDLRNVMTESKRRMHDLNVKSMGAQTQQQKEEIAKEISTSVAQLNNDLAKIKYQPTFVSRKENFKATVKMNPDIKTTTLLTPETKLECNTTKDFVYNPATHNPASLVALDCQLDNTAELLAMQGMGMAQARPGYSPRVSPITPTQIMGSARSTPSQLGSVRTLKVGSLPTMSMRSEMNSPRMMSEEKRVRTLTTKSSSPYSELLKAQMEKQT